MDLSAETEIRVETESGEWHGLYEARETSDGMSFWYFANPSDEYRITLVAHDERDFFCADVNATDGSHETLALMEPVEQLVGRV